MNKNILTKKFYQERLFYVILAVIVAICIVTTLYTQNQAKTETNNHAETTIVQADPEYISYVAVVGETSLAQLKESTPNVQTNTTEYGEYVDTIGTLVGGTDGKYWTFYIDGQMASVGAGSYIQKGGEKIEWKFVNLQ